MEKDIKQIKCIKPSSDVWEKPAFVGLSTSNFILNLTSVLNTQALIVQWFCIFRFNVGRCFIPEQFHF